MAIRATPKQIAALAAGKRPGKKRRPPVMVAASYADGTWTIPVRVVSESNQRDWVAKMKRKKAQRREVGWGMLVLSADAMVGWASYAAFKPIRVTFTKLGGQRLDVSNLPVSFKAIEDEVARLLGIDDGSERWLPVFEQEPGRGPVGIRIRIEAIEGAAS